MATKTSKELTTREKKNWLQLFVMHWPSRARWQFGMEMYSSSNKRASMGKADHLSVDHFVIYNRQRNTYNYHLFIQHPFIRLFVQLVARLVGWSVDRAVVRLKNNCNIFVASTKSNWAKSVRMCLIPSLSRIPFVSHGYERQLPRKMKKNHNKVENLWRERKK